MVNKQKIYVGSDLGFIILIFFILILLLSIKTNNWKFNFYMIPFSATILFQTILISYNNFFGIYSGILSYLNTLNK